MAAKRRARLGKALACLQQSVLVMPLRTCHFEHEVKLLRLSR